MKYLYSFFRNNILTGVLVTIPFALTIFVLYKLGTWIIGLVSAAPNKFVGELLNQQNPLVSQAILFTIGLVGALLIVLFVGAVTGTIATYFYLLTQKVMHHLVDQNHFFMRTGKLNENEWTNIGIATLIIFSIWSLSYAFFKLKEKEI